MGDITFSRVIDDAQAKITARSIQKRLADLGNTISYGHALEAAAAVMGFANWPTMHSALNSRVVAGEHSKAEIRRLPESAIPSFDAELRSIAVIGDGKTRRQALTALVSQAIAQYKAAKEDVAYYIVDAPEVAAMVKGLGSNNSSTAKSYSIELGKAGNQFNLFDLPAGHRNLKPSWLRDQKNILLRLIFSDAPNRYTRLFISQLVEDLYDSFSDAQYPRAMVRKYVRGMDREIDVCLAGEQPSYWWDVAETLRRAGHLILARRAEFLAAPKFEDFVSLAAEITPSTARERYNFLSIGDLEAACRFLSARASDVLKLYPFLNCSTDVDTSDATRLVCSLPSSAGGDFAAVMYALSIQMCKEHHYGRLLRSVDSEMKAGKHPISVMAAAEVLPKSMMVLGGFEDRCGAGEWKENMISLVEQSVRPLYKKAANTHAIFVEGGLSRVALFGRHPRSTQNIVYTGSAGDQKKQIDLEVVKDLNLHHTSLSIIDASMPTGHSGPIGALLVRDEQGSQREDYVELDRL